MSDVRNLPDAIQWHEGMLLSPHHFQELTTRQEALLHYHSRCIAPFHWGVERFEWDPGLLVSGVFRVTDLEAVLPDGQLVTSISGGDPELEIDLTQEVDDGTSSTLMIHLVLPARSEETASAEGEFSRYVSLEGDPVVDQNTGEQELRIPRLRPRIGLLVADVPPRRYASLPLAKISYSDQRFVMTEFIAPRLSAPVGSEISEMAADVAKRLRQKATFLSEKVRASGSTLDGVLLLEMKVMIQGLVASLPLLEAVLYTGRSHPYSLYLALCSVVGHIAPLGGGLVPPALKPYEHNDLRATFNELKSFVIKMLDESILESYTPIDLKLEDGVFGVLFEPDWMTRPVVLGVRRELHQTEEDLMQWVGGCLIGTESHTPVMRQNRVLGVRRTQVTDDEGLVGENGMLFYSLELDPRYITPGELLQVFNTAASMGIARPGHAVLYIDNKN